MNSNDQFGCGLLVAMVVVAAIVVGVVGAMKGEQLEDRIKQLESRTEFQAWWYHILDREYRKLKVSHEEPTVVIR